MVQSVAPPIQRSAEQGVCRPQYRGIILLRDGMVPELRFYHDLQHPIGINVIGGDVYFRRFIRSMRTPHYIRWSAYIYMLNVPESRVRVCGLCSNIYEYYMRTVSHRPTLAYVAYVHCYQP